jgi:hypothetical protein
MLSTFFKILLFATMTGSIVILGAACGGGGGGGGPQSSNDRGDISLSLETSAVDSGDLFSARVEIYNPNPNGVILKIRFPTTIRYSRNSAVLFPNEEDERPISPSFETMDEEFRYLVFILSNDEIRFGDYSALELNLKASLPDSSAFVSVDIDNNDPNIPDAREFDEKRPQFDAVDEVEIEIRGDLRPTPTPTKKAG